MSIEFGYWRKIVYLNLPIDVESNLRFAAIPNEQFPFNLLACKRANKWNINLRWFFVYFFIAFPMFTWLSIGVISRNKSEQNWQIHIIFPSFARHRLQSGKKRNFSFITFTSDVLPITINARNKRKKMFRIYRYGPCHGSFVMNNEWISFFLSFHWKFYFNV